MSDLPLAGKYTTGGHAIGTIEEKKSLRDHLAEDFPDVKSSDIFYGDTDSLYFEMPYEEVEVLLDASRSIRPVKRNQFTDQQFREIHCLGQTPAPMNLTAWDKRRMELNIEVDCGCCRDSIALSFDTWNPESPPDEDVIKYQNKVSAGIKNILAVHFHFKEKYTNSAYEVFAYLLLGSILRSEERISWDQLDQTDYIREKWNACTTDALTVLEHMNSKDWFTHGGNARTSCATSEGKDLLNSIWSPEIQEKRALEIIESLKQDEK